MGLECVQIAREARFGFAMHIARLGRHLSGSHNLQMSGATVDRFPVRRLHRVVTFVRRQ